MPYFRSGLSCVRFRFFFPVFLEHQVEGEGAADGGLRAQAPEEERQKGTRSGLIRHMAHTGEQQCFRFSLVCF